MLKFYQFKTHCKGDSHSSKTANIILPGLTIKQGWTILRLQAKYSRLRLFNLGGMSCFNQHKAQFNEFENHFAYKGRPTYCWFLSPIVSSNDEGVQAVKMGHVT